MIDYLRDFEEFEETIVIEDKRSEFNASLSKLLQALALKFECNTKCQQKSGLSVLHGRIEKRGRARQPRKLSAIRKIFKSAVADSIQGSEGLYAEYNDRKRIRKPPPYIKIKKNRVVPPVKMATTKSSVCDCCASNEFPCGPKSHCLNRLLSVECNVRCPAKEFCMNNRFTKRLYSKVELKYCQSKGWGLFAEDKIPSNSFIIEYIGEIIDTAEFYRRCSQMVAKKEKNFYIMSFENGNYIDAGIRGNESRFVNHSCEPNSRLNKWCVKGQTRIGLFAMVDIPKVDELSDGVGRALSGEL